MKITHNINYIDKKLIKIKTNENENRNITISTLEDYKKKS